MISPGFPAEMPFFTRGLQQVGANVIGIGDQPMGALPEMAQNALAGYVHVRSLWEEDDVLEEVLQLARSRPIERVECLWEPGMILAARIRERLGLPGMTVAETIPFRDKEKMKQVLDEADIRTPKHASSTSAEGIRRAAAYIGYPLIVKPIAGAGSKDTYRVNSDEELEQTIPLLGHIEEVSVEEFIDGDDLTFDTVCVGGEIAFANVFFYRPRALQIQTVEWISPQTIALRDPFVDHLAPGREMGVRVLQALGYQDGYTHMEWYRKPHGEAVFGEIAARPPGGRTVDLMNYTCDIDLFRGWAEAVVHGRFTQPVERQYNAAIIFKRAIGQGVIQRVEGLDRLMHEYGPHVAAVNLATVGTPRKNWRQSLTADGFVVVRHPDFMTCLEIADRVSTDVRLYAE
ncbi:MAG: ATP-grasp domain-containing protein [Candidatus Eisenbacteria bacterium]|uniref:ATP-grasp domain-containing protein n=1 Tax=Eiseniibacteriota bacterium TaxID=2212470 RepID=A0A956LZM4_UNCEI|nr:ATP-grasp domain-containing protein [Candidatus Eisenbacteria bacterium]